MSATQLLKATAMPAPSAGKKVPPHPGTGTPSRVPEVVMLWDTCIRLAHKEGDDPDGPIVIGASRGACE